MRIFELVKPKTPEQHRLDQLRATSQRASAAVKQERLRQQTQQAQKTLQKLRMPVKPKPATIEPIKTF
jgi:multidrug resistance efflux pump